MACPETRVGPGWEAQFAVNHLGHFALTCGLWPALTRASAARVVAVASGRSPEDRIRWHDVRFTDGYHKWAAYGQSKLANSLFAHHLDRLGAAHGVRAFSASPGYIRTPLQRHLTIAEMTEAGWLGTDGEPAPGLFRTPEQGAATPLWAATAATQGGAYCADCRESEPYPRDDVEAERLWRCSARLTVEELLAERGVTVDHVTVSRWVQRFTQEFIEAAGPCRHAPGDRWFVDETYVKVTPLRFSPPASAATATAGPQPRGGLSLVPAPVACRNHPDPGFPWSPSV